MDELASAAEVENGAINIYYELSSIMKLINPDLRKWTTNREQLKAIWKAEGQR